MFKKITSVLMLMIVLVLFTGCKDDKIENPGEVLENAYKETINLDSYQEKSEISLNVDFEGLTEEEKVQVEQIKSIINEVKLVSDFKYLKDEESDDIELSGQVSLENLNLPILPFEPKIEMYMDFENMIVKNPMDGKYLIMNLEELSKLSNVDYAEEFNYENMKEKNEKIVKEVIEKFKENMNTEKVTKVVNEEELTLDKIEITVEKDKIFDMLVEYINSDFYKDQLISQFKLQGFETEKPEEMAKEVQKTMLKSIEEFRNNEKLKMEDLKLTYYIENEKTIRASEITGNIEFEFEGKKIFIELDASSELFNINEIEEIEKPELTDENSVDYQEYIMNQMMSQNEKAQ